MTSLPERLGNWLPVVVAVALPLFFLPNLVDAFILPRTSIVVAGACVGGGLALLAPRPAALGALRWPVAAAAAAAFAAFAFSASWPLSLAGSYTRYESLPVRLSYLGLLVVPVWLMRTELVRSVAVAGFVLGTTVASAEAVGQWLLSVPFRPDGNVGNANLLGALIAMALPLAVAHMFRPGWIAGGWWAAAAILVAGLAATTSRSGMVASLAGAMAVGVFALRGRFAAAAAAGAGLVVVVAVAAVLFSPLRALNGDPGLTRLHLYQDALHMIAARPITGWGEDATGLVFGRFLSGDWSPGVTFDRAHSGPLDLAAMQGLLGAAALGSVLVVLFVGFWRCRSAPTAAAPRALGAVSVGSLGAACAGYTVWVLFNFDWAPATGAFWLLAGVGWSAARARTVKVPPMGDTAATPPHAFPPARMGARLVGALTLVAVAVAFGVLPLLAEGWYSIGRSDLAARADPLQSQYHRALGEALIQQGSVNDGREQLRLAANLGATDPALYVELGDADLRAGDVALARADYETALAVDPYWAPARQRLSGQGGLGAA